MHNKKLTDNEIIKALSNMTYGGHYCSKCKYDNGKGDDRCGLKGCKIARYALDLITRQQAENENLKVENQSLRGAANSLKMHYEEAQTEIERLRKEVNLVSIQFQDLQERYEEAQTEINRLNKENENLLCKLCEKVHRESKVIEKLIKTEAYKEFVEKLKEFMNNKFKDLDEYEFEYITERDINNLLKETVGEDNA